MLDILSGIVPCDKPIYREGMSQVMESRLIYGTIAPEDTCFRTYAPEDVMHGVQQHWKPLFVQEQWAVRVIRHTHLFPP